MRGPYLDDGDVRLYQGDVLDVLREMDEASVQTCVTSPPYWGLRDYGEPGQLGLEPTPGEYVARMVEVFRQVRRVLRDDGTLWLNLGDSYFGSGKGPTAPTGMHGANGTPVPVRGVYTHDTIKPKDLVGIPWRVALALQDDGWWLRSDIIWAKPNPMPESITDRPTRSHEYLFLLTKSARYFYDAAAVAEPAVGATAHDLTGGGLSAPGQTPQPSRVEKLRNVRPGVDVGSTAGQCAGVIAYTEGTRNARSVWTITTKPYAGAHFATFPPELPSRCIKAGSRQAGKRCDCDEIIFTPTGSGAIDDPSITTGRAGMNRPRRSSEGTRPITRREQRDYAVQIRDSPHREEMRRESGPAFDHYIRTDASGARPAPDALLVSWTARGWLREPSPCICPVQPADVVLDPFSGAATTALVARGLGRRAVGIELNPEYLTISADRLKQLSLFGEMTG